MHSFIFTHTTLESTWERIKEITGSSPELNDYHHPDIFILQPEINEKSVHKNASIKIEMVRVLQGQLSQAPLRLPFQIGIINQAESITLPAQQALLKLLEEPKNNTFLFLITSDSQHVFLPTILSRCQLIAGKLSLETQSDIDGIEKQLEDLHTYSLAQRMKYFESYNTPDKIIPWIKTAIPCLEKSLRIKQDKNIIVLLQNLQTAFTDIQGNVNTKLVLDMLAIHWDKTSISEQ